MTSDAEGSFELGTDGPKVILVGVDNSTTSIWAAGYTAGLARRPGASVTAVYVAPVASLGAASPGGADLAAARREAFGAPLPEWQRTQADDVADAITHIMTRPRHVAVNETLIRPTEQER